MTSSKPADVTASRAPDTASPIAEGDGNNGEAQKTSIDDIPETIQIAEATLSVDQVALADQEKLRTKYLLQRFWHTAKGFWSRQRGDRLAWLLTLSLLVLILANLAAMYGINRWNRAIFDALEQK